MPLSKELKKYRKKRGLTQYDLADLLGVNRSRIYFYEIGKSKYIYKTTAEKFKKRCPDIDWDKYVYVNRLSKRCCVRNCFNYQVSRRYCEKHYYEYKRYKKILKPNERRAEKGSGHLDKNGYIRVVNPSGGQTFQHRLVMEEFLKRPLLKHENIHHINGIRNDNRIENLELWSKSQPCGQKVKDKIDWAIKFLTEYGYNINKKD